MDEIKELVGQALEQKRVLSRMKVWQKIKIWHVVNRFMHFADRLLGMAMCRQSFARKSSSQLTNKKRVLGMKVGIIILARRRVRLYSQY